MKKGEPNFHADWQPARLLSTIGLRGEEEKERRATSALLAVMMSVPEFGQELITTLGGPKGRISTFTEIQLKDADGKLSIPDGAIVCERGANVWCALVEVKTGTSPLKSEQVSRYLDLARANGFDSVITISNRITAERTDRVVDVDKRKLKSVQLRHISWWRILTAAIVQHRHKGVSDPDQAWILGELIAYLDNERSGASGFQGMGESWVVVRDAATHGTLRSADPGAREVASKWDQYVEYLALSMSQELGREVKPVRARASTPESRCAAFVKEMVEQGSLTTDLKVPDAVGPITISANLRTKQVTTSVSLKAPDAGRPLTRINWALKQTKDAPSDLRLDVKFASTRETTSLLRTAAAEDPALLLFPGDAKREPKGIEFALTRKMGLKRGIDGGSFARETRRQLLLFYRDLVQDLKPWVSSAPRIESEAVNDEVD